jgi:eukaryotic-like serine/threonine-protein kinase
VYSLGVILYHLLVGKAPYEGALPAIIHQILHCEPLAPRAVRPGVSREIENICLKAISKNPADRYTDARSFADDLQRFLSGQQTVARPESVLSRAWKRFCEAPRLTRGAAFCAIAGAVSAVIASWSFSRQAADFASNASIPSISNSAVVDSEERLVHIFTEPAGARLALAIIDEDSGAPRESRVIRPTGVTPLDVSLPPGLYLVVADIPGHGFHEVYRTVPAQDESLIINGIGKLPAERSDGTLDMPVIRIPTESEARHNLVRFSGGHIVMGEQIKNSPLFRHEADVAPFYLQSREVTVGEFRSTMGEVPTAEEFQELGLTDQHPIVMIPFAKAVSYAEEIGLRLPFTHELEWAMTNGGTTRFPWGDDISVIQDWQFGEVGVATFDRTLTDPPVYGLFSNVAEFTDSREQPVAVGAMKIPEIVKVMARHAHIVRGGPLKVTHRGFSERELRDGPVSTSNMEDGSARLGVGFRCARSEKPRFLDQ